MRTILSLWSRLTVLKGRGCAEGESASSACWRSWSCSVSSAPPLVRSRDRDRQRAAELDPARYKPSKNDRNSYIYTSDGRVLAVLRGSEARIVVKSEEISNVMKQAIVAVEDRRFFEHRGVDLRGIARAIWQDLRNRAVVEGGSTITQQFVKNAYVKSSRSFERKLNEAALAWQLEQRWSKDRILTAYLNTIYFGNGAYGIEQASRVYFRHRAASLSSRSRRCSPASPPTRPYDPAANPRKRKRGATSSCARCSTRATSRRRSTGAPTTSRCRSRATSACRHPGTGAVLYELREAAAHRPVRPRMSSAAGCASERRSTSACSSSRGRRSRSGCPPSDEGPSAALVAIDPRDGRVLAMYGGRNYAESQFNLAVQGTSAWIRVRCSPSRPRSSRASPPRRPSCPRP